MERKFEETFNVGEWEILTEDGYKDIITSHKTVPYEIWRLETESFSLYCADDHLVFKEDGEIFVKDLKIGDKIKTKNGLESVTMVATLEKSDNMYDIQINSFEQSYYTNGILSHNTASSALYLLWYAMFISDCTILIAAHKKSGAIEIMDRIRYAYESCEDFIRAGVTTYSTEKIVFDNKSRIIAQATTENTGRGLSISLLYCLDKDTKVTVKDKDTGEIKDITLEGLYTELDNNILESIEEQKKMKIMFSDNSYIEVYEDETLIVNDIKTTIENITHGSEILVGNDYLTVRDIDYS